MTIELAEEQLDSIRNNRTDSPHKLLDRVDKIGMWLAQQEYSKRVAKLLSECHQLSERLDVGSGRFRVMKEF